MKKMVKVILVCTAVLCAIDQIMRFTGPYAIAHIWNDMVLDGELCGRRRNQCENQQQILQARPESI